MTARICKEPKRNRYQRNLWGVRKRQFLTYHTREFIYTLSYPYTKFTELTVKSLKFKLIIQEIIIEKCQNCLLAQTFRMYNPSSVISHPEEGLYTRNVCVNRQF